MSNEKYVTFFSLLNLQTPKTKAKVKLLSIVFFVLYFTYLVSSVVTILLESGHITEILLKVGEILSIAASILISIIAVIISNIYNSEIARLLNDIISANQPLGLVKKTKKSKFNILAILVVIDLVIICLLFLVNSFFQIITMCTDYMAYLHTTIMVLTLSLDIAMIVLNILSIWDCIYSSKEYKQTISEVEVVNEKLFDMYNKNLVNQSLDRK